MSSPEVLVPSPGAPPSGGPVPLAEPEPVALPVQSLVVGQPDRRYARFELLRDYLKHEDNLVDHRIKWNLTIQGFLFTAFGFSLGNKGDSALLSELASLLIPIAGCVISLCATCGIFAAHLSLKNLARHWDPKNNDPA